MIFILLLVLSQIAIAVLQWFEYLPSYNSNFRFSGIFFNPSPYIIFLSAILIYCLTVGLCNTNKIIKIVGIVLFVAAIPIVLITLSRSAWLGLIAGVLLVLFIRFHLFKKVSRWFRLLKFKIIGISMLMVVVSFAAYYLYHLKKESADGRILVWKLSFNIIDDHPFTGIGQDRFSARIIEYQSVYFKQHPDRMLTEGRLADTVYYAFNDTLQITVEQGLIGLVLFGVVILTGVKFIRRLISDPTTGKIVANDGIIIGTIASVAVILVSGLTSYPLMMLPIKVLFLIALGILSAIYENTMTVDAVYKSERKILPIIGIIAGISLMIYSAALSHAYYLANNIAKYGYDKDPDAMNKLTQYKLLVNTEEWYALRQCDYLINKEQYTKAIVEMEKAKKITASKALYFSLAQVYVYEKQYDKAEAQLMLMYYALPGLVAPKYRLAKFYYDTHQKAKWDRAADEVISFKLKVYSPIAVEMVNEIMKLKY